MILLTHICKAKHIHTIGILNGHKNFRSGAQRVLTGNVLVYIGKQTLLIKFK